ncbi:hypothetical protein CR513_49899, partial [Mucuna pruriens]
MSLIGLSFLFLFSLALLSIARGQERAPHGIVYESPLAFPPAAYDFFHPNAQKPETRDPCAASKCSPLPLAAQVDATHIYENKASAMQKGGKQIRAGGVAGIIIAVAFAVLLAMGIYYVKVTRQANMSRATNSVVPEIGNWKWKRRCICVAPTQPSPLIPLPVKLPVTVPIPPPKSTRNEYLGENANHPFLLVFLQQIYRNNTSILSIALSCLDPTTTTILLREKASGIHDVVFAACFSSTGPNVT